MQKNDLPFMPLVTRTGQIVGYCGKVRGDDLWTDDIPLDISVDDKEWIKLVNSGVVTVHYAVVTDAEKWRRQRDETGWTHRSNIMRYYVLCSIHGEVLAILAAHLQDDSIESEGLGPIEIFLSIPSGAGAIKALAKAIGRRVIALGKAAGRKTFVRIVGKRSPKKILWGTWNDYPKVTVDGQVYAKVGDRLYSQHAVERMQPSGLRTNRAAGRGDGSRDGGYPQIQQAGGSHPYAYGRGVPPYWVEEAIKVKGIPQANGNVAHKIGTLQVIVNNRGAVVTVETFSK